MKLDISCQLAKLMDECGLSQSALCRATGVPQPTINRILSGVTVEPRRKAVVALASHFGVSPDYLYQEPQEQASADAAVIDRLHGQIAVLSEAERSELFHRLSSRGD